MNRGRHPSTVSYADRAIARFRNWPLQVCHAECRPGSALAASGRQIVHFHQSDLAEVHLTRSTIDRLAAVLDASGRVDLDPEAGWAQVHLDTGNDLFLLESLVSLAIQANDPVVRPPHQIVPACPYASRLRRTRLRRGKPSDAMADRAS